jgi:hypothetical protein
LNKTLVILGNYEGTRGLFDWKRKDCDIWALNEMLSQTDPTTRWIERADAIFQLHDESIWRNPANRTDPGHYDWLRTQTDVPVYMQKHYDDVPMSVEYPLEEIKTFLLANFNIKDVFSSTLSYCMALAIRNGYTAIETYGVEMGTESEYFHQREGFTFWVGVAVGQGIRTSIHTTELMHAPLYGYQGEVTLPYEDFVERIKQIEPAVEELVNVYNCTKIDTAIAIKALKDNTTADTITKVIETINAQNQAAVTYAIQEGGRQENERYVKKADIMREVSGGKFVFSRQEFESARVSMMQEHQRKILQAQTNATRSSLMVQSILTTKNKTRRMKRIDQLAMLIEEYVKTNVEAGMLAGAIAEDHAYLKRLDAGIRAAGGERSIEAMNRMTL